MLRHFNVTSRIRWNSIMMMITLRVTFSSTAAKHLDLLWYVVGNSWIYVTLDLRYVTRTLRQEYDEVWRCWSRKPPPVLHLPNTMTHLHTFQSIVPFTSYYITLRYITLHYTALHYITLHYVILRYDTLRYITLHYIALHYITLRYVTCRVRATILDQVSF